MILSDTDESEYARLFQAKHGVDPIHASLKISLWNVCTWNNDDIAGIVSNPRSVGKELDAIWSEANNTERNTVVKPLLSELNYSTMKNPILYEKPKPIPNILTNVGMNNMAKLSTGESTDTNTHCYVGDDSTPAEAVGDTDLQNELDNKAFDTDGDRETVDQQERYAMAFFRSDFGMDVTLREAGIGTGITLPTDILVARVTFADKPVGSGQTMTVQLTATHKNGTI